MRKKITTDKSNQNGRDKFDGGYKPRRSQLPPRQQPPEKNRVAVKRGKRSKIKYLTSTRPQETATPQPVSQFFVDITS